MASESSFRVNINADSTIGKPRGLIQVTEQTRQILTDQKGELKDFYDPNLNLCAGIRWLFHKKYLASHRLKRDATWIEAIAEYKGILPQLGKVEKADKIMISIHDYFKRLSQK